MTFHELKVWPEYFAAMVDGRKSFEVRKNDRDYRVGDTLLLREYAPGPDKYTGHFMTFIVTYMVSGSDPMGYAFGVRGGFVVMGLKSKAVA